MSFKPLQFKKITFRAVSNLGIYEFYKEASLIFLKVPSDVFQFISQSLYRDSDILCNITTA